MYNVDTASRACVALAVCPCQCVYKISYYIHTYINTAALATAAIRGESSFAAFMRLASARVCVFLFLDKTTRHTAQHTNTRTRAQAHRRHREPHAFLRTRVSFSSRLCEQRSVMSSRRRRRHLRPRCRIGARSY